MIDAIKITVHVFDKENKHIHKLELDPVAYDDAEKYGFFDQDVLTESASLSLSQEFGVDILSKIAKIVPTYKNVTIGGNKNAT